VIMIVVVIEVYLVVIVVVKGEVEVVAVIIVLVVEEVEKQEQQIKLETLNNTSYLFPAARTLIRCRQERERSRHQRFPLGRQTHR